jgi:peptidoglycan/LPS O-acetylase OafA/YrhL
VFLANFAHLFHVASDGPYWTLAIEEQFYLIWPRVIHRRSTAAVSKLALSIIVVESVVRLISAALGHGDFIFTFYHCDGLAFGALLACKYRRWELEPPRPGENSWGIFRWIALGGLSLAAVCVYSSTKENAYFTSALLLTAVGLLFYAVIGGAVKHSGGALLRPFRSRPLVFLGQVSYCLYMIHPYIVNLYDKFHGKLAIGDAFQYFLRAVVVVTISLACCVVSLYVIERPAQSLRKYVVRK